MEAFEASLVNDIERHCARSFMIRDDTAALSYVGLGLDPHPMPNITSLTREAWHRFVLGSGRHGHDPQEAIKIALVDFRLNAEFPFPSLMPRMTVGWRRKPKVELEQDFQSGMIVCKITARYALILDWPEPEPES
jgi:hypothetical protein